MIEVNDLVDKIFKGIGKRDSTPKDSIPRDSTSKNFKYKKIV